MGDIAHAIYVKRASLFADFEAGVAGADGPLGKVLLAPDSLNPEGLLPAMEEG